MRLYFTILFMAVAVMAKAQGAPVDSAVAETQRAAYVRHSTILSLGVGFMDLYKSGYKLPNGFADKQSSGFTPVYLKVEYGLGKHFGLAANFMYDGFYETYAQHYYYYGTVYSRYIKDQVHAFQAGLLVNYHFAELIPVKRLDVYIAAGGCLNRVAHNNMPQDDTTVQSQTKHGAVPVAKLGLRYNISSHAAIYAEGGYDGASIFGVGFSCRFFRKDGAGKP
jgi:hypothetical protein